MRHFIFFVLLCSALKLFGCVSSLTILKIDLPESFLSNIEALENEVRHQWNQATYYRETIDFGKVFPALEEGRLEEKPIPPFIVEIRNQLFEKFKEKLDENDRPEDYDNIILTIYQSGDGIAPHIDRNLEWALRAEDRKYYFGESIIGLIVEPDTLQSLFFQNPALGEESRFYLNEEQGTAFLFQGELRHKWKHGLLPIENRRISITFRKVERFLKAALAAHSRHKDDGDEMFGLKGVDLPRLNIDPVGRIIGSTIPFRPDDYAKIGRIFGNVQVDFPLLLEDLD